MGIPDPELDAQFYRGVPLRRFVAFLIDTAVIIGLWLVVQIVVTILTIGVGLALAPFLIVLTGVLYRSIMLARRSATLGMMLTGIEVRDRQGARCDNAIAILHTLAFYVTLFFPPLLLIGWILMATSPIRRAMHDVMLGTVVINRPA